MLDTSPRVGLAAGEVPPVRAGNVCDAKALRHRLQQLLAGLERADETLLRLVAQAQANRIHMVLEDEHGKFFRDWTSFATAPVPWGLGLSPALVEELAREHRDPARRARLVMDAPLVLRYRGGQPGHLPTRAPGGAPLDRPRTPRRRVLNGTDYVLQRLKRDHPALLRQVAEGALSVPQAAERAGLHRRMLRVWDSPMAFARAIVTTFDPPRQREVVDLVQHPERITAPPGANNAAWKRYQQASTPPEDWARQQAAHREAIAAGRRARDAARARARRAASSSPGQPPAAPHGAGAGAGATAT
jgi:hypothetical protein